MHDIGLGYMFWRLFFNTEYIVHPNGLGLG